MYSEKITPKVERLFDDLRAKIDAILENSGFSSSAVDEIVKAVSVETSSRSKSILSDMLFDLSDQLFETPFFADDVSRRNRFTELNVRQEIMDKYKFSANGMNYKEASCIIQALKVGGATFVAIGATEVGYVLIKGLEFSCLVPIPVGVLVAATLGAALVEYFAVAPSKNKKELCQVIDKYLNGTQTQFLAWFDEVERYFNKRVDEFQKTY